MAQIFYPGRPRIDTDDAAAVQLMAHVRQAWMSGEHAWHTLDDELGGSVVLHIGPNIPVSITLRTESLPVDDLASSRPAELEARGVSAVDAYYEAGRRADE